MATAGERRDNALPLRRGRWRYSSDLRFRAGRSGRLGRVTLEESFGVDHQERERWVPRLRAWRWDAVLDHLEEAVSPESQMVQSTLERPAVVPWTPPVDLLPGVQPLSS